MARWEVISLSVKPLDLFWNGRDENTVRSISLAIRFGSMVCMRSGNTSKLELPFCISVVHASPLLGWYVLHSTPKKRYRLFIRCNHGPCFQSTMRVGSISRKPEQMQVRCLRRLMSKKKFTGSRWANQKRLTPKLLGHYPNKKTGQRKNFCPVFL